ncbi:uncharacterized protein METZ01_LOCUS341276, partial [marine metagenome]
MKLKALALFLSLNAAFLCFSAAVEKKSEKKFYDPVIKTVEGWTIEYDPQLLSEDNMELGEEATKALANHLQRIKYILPKEKVSVLQKLPIRIDLK